MNTRDDEVAAKFAPLTAGHTGTATPQSTRPTTTDTATTGMAARDLERVGHHAAAALRRCQAPLTSLVTLHPRTSAASSSDLELAVTGTGWDLHSHMGQPPLPALFVLQDGRLLLAGGSTTWPPAQAGTILITRRKRSRFDVGGQVRVGVGSGPFDTPYVWWGDPADAVTVDQIGHPDEGCVLGADDQGRCVVRHTVGEPGNTVISEQELADVVVARIRDRLSLAFSPKAGGLVAVDLDAPVGGRDMPG